MGINCRETRWSLPGNGEGEGAGLVECGFEDTEGQFKKHLQLSQGWLQNLQSQILLRSSTWWALTQWLKSLTVDIRRNFFTKKVSRLLSKAVGSTTGVFSRFRDAKPLLSWCWSTSGRSPNQKWKWTKQPPEANPNQHFSDSKVCYSWDFQLVKY